MTMRERLGERRLREWMYRAMNTNASRYMRPLRDLGLRSFWECSAATLWQAKGLEGVCTTGLRAEK
jgi:hypothetical protein